MKTRLVVLFGGRSAEHEVSCVTAVSVLRALDPVRYDVVPVGITTAGRWMLAEEAQRLLAAGGAAALPPALEAKGTELEPFAALAPDPATFAGSGPVVVLPLLHGPFGEDGTVQGLCELADVPYVGSGVLGSAVAMDKLTTKRLVAAAGLPVPAYLGLRDHEIDGAVAARVEATLGWPVFVKPSNLGSSVGVSKASDPAELDAALAEALRYDEWVIVEEAIVGREIECGVLGDLEPEASVPGEVRPSREFYDYEDKYVDGKAELLVPAPLPDEVAADVRTLALAAFAAVRAEGMARVDLFYEEPGPRGPNAGPGLRGPNEEPGLRGPSAGPGLRGPNAGHSRGLLVNEVNTIPGFTPISMYPRLWEASGVPYPVLLDRLVQFAVDRHRRRQDRVGRTLRGAPPGT